MKLKTLFFFFLLYVFVIICFKLILLIESCVPCGRPAQGRIVESSPTKRFTLTTEKNFILTNILKDWSLNTLRGWIYDIGLRIYNAKKWLYFFDKCMVLEILNQCSIIRAAKCVVPVVEHRPCSHIRLHLFCVNGLASFATEMFLRQLIF